MSSEPIEKRLLDLASRATPGPWLNVEPAADRLSRAGVCSVRGAMIYDAPLTGETSGTAAFIAQCDPSTVFRLARVVATGRMLLDGLSLSGNCPATNCDSEDPTGLDGLREPEPHSEGCVYVAAREAYRALDAEQEGAE